MGEIESIQRAIASLEAQRSLLGDEVVETALGPLREKLAGLQPVAEQRRLVTVVFADLVGFTALSAGLDPEDVREIMQAYFSRWQACLERYGGTVEKYIGDAVMAVFGLSVSREDDPESAIRAALDMRQALIELNRDLTAGRGLSLSMRVGVNTGTVMVSRLDDGGGFVAVGDTVNRASRIQAAAPVDGILISHDTYRHVRGVFDVRPLDPLTVKGVDAPLQTYAVLRAKQRAFRTASRGVEGIETGLVGRAAELRQLQDALRAAAEQRVTQAVTVSGEAGIGKSRLVAEFNNWVELQPQVVRYYQGRAAPATQNLPFSLLRDMFSFRFEIQDSDPPQVVQARLERGLAEALGPPAGSGQADDIQRRAQFVGHLLGFQLAASSRLLGALADADAFRDRALADLTEYFRAVGAARPIVMLLEDIHWADDGSLDVIEQLLAELPSAPLVVVAVARPTLFERRADWLARAQAAGVVHQRLPLASLARADSQRLVDEILQKMAEVPAALRDLVVHSAEGNPFYVEELIKMLIEEGVIHTGSEPWRVDLTRLAQRRIPSTLVEVLQARFDSLSRDEQVLLQRASVLGRVFWDAAVGAMEAGEDGVRLGSRLPPVLARLNAREMIYPQAGSAFSETREYHFKHALLRDATYEGVLKRLRRVYHASAAAWLSAATERSQRADEYAALLAEHYERAGNAAQAREWYQRASRHASQHYANAEGVRCLTRCLELWPSDDLAGVCDLRLQRSRLFDVLADRPAQRADLEAAQALADQLDPLDANPHSRQAEMALAWWHFWEANGDHAQALAAARRAIDASHATGDRQTEANARLQLGVTYWRQADYAAARDHLERGLRLAQALDNQALEGDYQRHLGVVAHYQADYDEARSRYQAARALYEATGHERGQSMVLNSLGSLLVDLGQYAEARGCLEQSLALKRKIGHRRGEHITLHNLGMLADQMGDHSAARRHLEQVAQFTAQDADADGEADARLALGTVLLHLGRAGEAGAQLTAAQSLYRRQDNRMGDAQALLGLGRLAERLGDYPAALAHSQAAAAQFQDLGLPRDVIQARLAAAHAHLGLGAPAAAEAELQQALALARQQELPALLTEVLAGLAAADAAQGRLAEARAPVTEVLNRLAAAGGRDPIAGLDLASLAGLDEPFRVLLICVQVLAAGGDGRAEPLLAAAQRLLREQAAGLDEADRPAYLDDVPAHRALAGPAAERRAEAGQA
jgi:class 3 adenylate cyclase/tetratricopeptide (TPR) repeat protein